MRTIEPKDRLVMRRERMSINAVRPESPFTKLLQEQVSREFTAQQQYVALAVWFDSHDLPQLAALFYRQAVEERNHAMMLIQYLLDRDIPPVVPGVCIVRNDFKKPAELIELALRQEEQVTAWIEELFKAARDDGDFLGEQFILWFLKEQVEELARMNTLLTITERAGDDYFKVEEFVARENIGDTAADTSAPRAAGGVL
jgi:ferritin